MSTPARRRTCPYLSRQRPAATDRAGRPVQWTGRLLCWSLAAGMAGAATEALLHPEVGWWPPLWPLPWYLTPATALAWGLLRLREKAAHRQPDDHDDIQAEEYGQAA
ncbi:hypothetical protein ABTZ21_37650 [Streptomyces sp. NPDC096191]|uniref:hypothetical protein n=1 Tax=Streptomyces sp. NPDC096191 TaxID=3155426 RepID=UPI00332AB509